MISKTARRIPGGDKSIIVIMMNPKIIDNKVVFGPCRLSYTHLFEKYTGPDGDESRAIHDFY